MVIGRVIINPDDYSLEFIGVCRGKGAFSFLETRTKIPKICGKPDVRSLIPISLIDLNLAMRVYLPV